MILSIEEASMPLPQPHSARTGIKRMHLVDLLAYGVSLLVVGMHSSELAYDGHC
jgi:hypothetical protein